jgi:hypothetical protein
MIELFGWFALGWATARGVQSLLRGRSTDREPRFTEGRTIRGNGNGGPSTPKPPIKPQPNGGYQPRPQRGTPNPPPSEP